MKMKMLMATTAVMVAGAAQAETWDMPMAYAASNFHSEHGVIFADKVKEYTNGDLELTIHAGGSLFGGGEIKRAVQTGQANIGERFMSAHANEAPILAWDNLPFIAASYENNAKLWEAARDAVNEDLSEQNLVALYTCPWPGQGFYFNKEVASSEDTQGIKFRSYNSATATFAEELGMVPVQIEAAELSQALATGVAEAFISSGSTGYDRKVWEHLSHYYKVNAYTGFGALAAVFLIIILLIIMGQMGARWGGVSFPGSTAYAGYAMAASSFFALAYTLVKGAHIRVSILLQIAPGKAFWVDAFASLIAAWIATFFARFAIRAAVFSEMLNDRTQGQDQVPDWLLAVASMFGTWPWEWGALWAEVTGEWVYTPIWLPQISMAVGCVLLAIAMWDMLFRLLLNGETSIKGEAVE